MHVDGKCKYTIPHSRSQLFVKEGGGRGVVTKNFGPFYNITLSSSKCVECISPKCPKIFWVGGGRGGQKMLMEVFGDGKQGSCTNDVT